MGTDSPEIVWDSFFWQLQQAGLICTASVMTAMMELWAQTARKSKLDIFFYSCNHVWAKLRTLRWSLDKRLQNFNHISGTDGLTSGWGKLVQDCNRVLDASCLKAELQKRFHNCVIHVSLRGKSPRVKYFVPVFSSTSRADLASPGGGGSVSFFG